MKQRIQCSKHTSVIASHHRYTNNVQYWECRVNHDTNLETMMVDWFGFNDEDLDEKSKSQHKTARQQYHGLFRQHTNDNQRTTAICSNSTICIHYLKLLNT